MIQQNMERTRGQWQQPAAALSGQSYEGQIVSVIGVQRNDEQERLNQKRREDKKVLEPLLEQLRKGKKTLQDLGDLQLESLRGYHQFEMNQLDHDEWLLLDHANCRNQILREIEKRAEFYRNEQEEQNGGSGQWRQPAAALTDEVELQRLNRICHENGVFLREQMEQLLKALRERNTSVEDLGDSELMALRSYYFQQEGAPLDNHEWMHWWNKVHVEMHRRRLSYDFDQQQREREAEPSSGQWRQPAAAAVKVEEFCEDPAGALPFGGTAGACCLPEEQQLNDYSSDEADEQQLEPPVPRRSSRRKQPNPKKRF